MRMSKSWSVEARAIAFVVAASVTVVVVGTEVIATVMGEVADWLGEERVVSFSGLAPCPSWTSLIRAVGSGSFACLVPLLQRNKRK